MKIFARRWVKWGSRLLIISGLIYFIFKSPLSKSILSWGLVASLPTDSGAPVDAIVVLGRGSSGFLMESRIDVAVQLWKAGRAPFIFASGRPEARAMMEALREEGVPLDNIRGEECSNTTEENALFTSSILLPENAQNILLITDLPHMLRSFLTFRSLGFKVIPYPTPFSQNDNSQFPGKVISKEYRGILGYAALGRFLPRTYDNPRYLPADRLEDALSGDCTVILESE